MQDRNVGGHPRSKVLAILLVVGFSLPMASPVLAQASCAEITRVVQEQQAELTEVHRKYRERYTQLVVRIGETIGQLYESGYNSVRLERSLQLLAEQREDFTFAFESFMEESVGIPNAVCSGEHTQAITKAATIYIHIRTMQDKATFIDQHLYQDLKQGVAEVNSLISARAQADD